MLWELFYIENFLVWRVDYFYVFFIEIVWVGVNDGVILVKYVWFNDLEKICEFVGFIWFISEFENGILI